MNLALDFDKTYTLDAPLWDKVIALFRAAGHRVYCVTMRYDEPDDAEPVRRALGGKVDGIIFTGCQRKLLYVADNHPEARIDVWIDDKPHLICP